MSGRVDPRRANVGTLLTEVGLTPAFAGCFPSNQSGGERQRVATAQALAIDPALLVRDEPVWTLDVSVQAQVLNLFKHNNASLGLS